MDPEDRRDALIEVFVRLAHRDKGREPISTREIAQAAGIAEGTIFRVFPTRRASMQAAVAGGVRPGRRVGGARRPCEPECPCATGSSARRVSGCAHRMRIDVGAVGRTGRQLAARTELHRRRAGTCAAAAATRARRPSWTAVHRASSSCRRDEPAASIPVATSLLRMPDLLGRPPGIADGQALTADEIVDIVLSGALARRATADM